MSSTENPDLSKDLVIQNDFAQLEKALSVLREMGFKVCDRFINIDLLRGIRKGDPEEFPLVDDGLNGIRATYHRDGLVVWFTNGFESPENPQRKEVTQKLRDLGMKVI